MKTRIQEEVRLLQEKYPALEHGPNFEWILIPNFPLPRRRFNKASSRLQFVLPIGYPQTGPDNFFVEVDLRLTDGAMPVGFNANSNSSSGPAPVEGNWGWFSWHPQKWTATANVSDGDNLLVFISGIQMCLRGEESA